MASVIARHKRNWLILRLNSTTQKVFVYDKEKSRQPILTYHSIREAKASAYLKFIVDHYDNLPEYTLFIHDEEYSWHHEGSVVDRYYEAISSNKKYVNINSISCIMRYYSITKCLYEKAFRMVWPIC
jgi:hypothetical protein